MRNTAIMPGADSLADMIGAIDNGYYLKRSTNGQADLTSEFMFGVGCGYEIKNGKIGRAIRDTTISGVALMLRAVTHVGERAFLVRRRLVREEDADCGRHGRPRHQDTPYRGRPIRSIAPPMKKTLHSCGP